MAIVPGKSAVVKNADGYDEVAARVKPSSTVLWDLPGNSVIDIIDEWAECEYEKHHGFIKAKNLPGVHDVAAGVLCDVKDSYKGNSETCMRRHAEQDSTKGNVCCYVPNAKNIVKFVERWVEFKWKTNRGFVKARHVQPVPEGGVVAAAPARGAAAAVPPARGEASAPPVRGAAAMAPLPRGGAAAAPDEEAVAKEPPAKKARVDPAVDAPAAGVEEGGAAGSDSKADPIGDVEMAPAEEKTVAPPAEAVPTKPAPLAAGEALADEAAAPVPAAETAAPEQTVEVAAPPAAVEAAPAAAAAAAPAAPAVAAAPAVVAPAAGSRDCDCCMDSVSPDQGVLCPGKLHFFCSACLPNFLTAFKTADYAEQKKGKGRALCPMKDSDVPFGDGGLAAFVPQDVFDEYLQIRIKVAEQGIQEQMEKESRDKIEELKGKLAKATGDAEQMEIDKHRLKIIDDIFTLKCPRCKQAFLDYDSCSAITCAGCACGFCSYCLEDCGKDAHQHFYKNKSKCPKEGGPLFIDHKKWIVYQNKRKGKLLAEYVATVPEASRQTVCDLIAPDAKDLGIDTPTDLSTAALAPDKCGILRVKLSVPRKMRGALAAQAKLLGKKGVELKLPDPKAKVELSNETGGPWIVVKKEPTKVTAAKNIAARLTQGYQVKIDDDWCEMECKKEKIKHGWIKAKHTTGRLVPNSISKIKDAGGHGSVMVRHECKQPEGDNSQGFLDDGTEIKVVKHWIECTWEGDGGGVFGGAVKPGRGFVEAEDLPDDDVILVGKGDDVWLAAVQLEKDLGVELYATKEGAVDGGKGKGKAKGRGRGRGRG